MGGHGYQATAKPDYTYYSQCLANKFFSQRDPSITLCYREILDFAKSQPSIPEGITTERLAAMISQAPSLVLRNDWQE